MAARGGRLGRWLWLLVVPVVLLAAHTLYWRWTAERLEEGFAAWAAARRANGWAVRAGTGQRGGWPIAAMLQVSGFTLEGAGADIPGGMAWSSERITLSVKLFYPRVLTVEAEGPQQLRLGDLPNIPYTADRLHADVPLDPGFPAHTVDVAATNLRAGMPAGKEGTSGVTIASAQLHAEARPSAQQGEPALAFNLNADAIALPSGLSWALGGRISSFLLDGALNGPLPPRSPGLARRAEAWRDAGGTFEVQRLALAWGPLDLTASATLALDMQLQPMGAGNARIIGYAETIDALATSGAITRRAGIAVKALAALIAHTPEGGGPPEIEVPLSLQNRTLAIRQIPLARLPELKWPAE